MWEKYYTPNTMKEALRILEEHRGQARIVAGATDIMLELERGQRPGVKVLIDITRIPGLDQITLDDQGRIHLGPVVCHNHCASSRLIVDRAFALAQACWQIGSPQIRNRGTIAGNLITASPANDAIAPLMAFGARLTLTSVAGKREVGLDEFYTGVRRNVMGDNEILTDIAFPAQSENGHSAFYKLALRRAQAISLVNAAIMIELDGSTVARAAITLGAVAPTIVHAKAAEEFLVGKQLNSEVIAEVGDLTAEAAKPIDDVRATAIYRKQMARICIIRCLRALAAGNEKEEYPAHPVMLWGAKEPHWTRQLPQSYEHQKGDVIATTINGKRHEFRTGYDKSLLRLLREEAGLIGSKEGCDEGECGACTVHLDGRAVMSCMVPAPRAHMAEIATIEGLAANGKLNPIQQAFIDEGAVQCGYCTPGFLMSAAKLLEECPHPSRRDIVQAIAGNLCRCTGYYKIISAIEKAAEMQGTKPDEGGG